MRLFPLTALLLGVASGPTHADSLRCGDRIVGDDASVSELQAACGRPDYRDAHTTGYGNEEDWTYNFGHNRLLEIVHIRNGRVTTIEADGYGFEADEPKPCTPTDLADGMSKYRLLRLCGKPQDQESYGALTPLRRRDGRISGRGLYTVYREKWTYDFGPQYFLQFVTLENGRITDVSSGQRGGRRP